jgi:hypothetical protein
VAGRIWRTAVRRGLFGGSRPWTAALVVMGAMRLIKRFAGSQPETVFREELPPGQALLITHRADLHLGDEPR